MQIIVEYLKLLDFSNEDIEKFLKTPNLINSMMEQLPVYEEAINKNTHVNK